MDAGSKLRELLPHEKGDTERAEAIVALGYPAVAPILPDLIEWLQDCNWPVAHVLSPFLAQIGLPLLPPVRAVLATNDYQWKYWVLLRLVEPSPDLVFALHDEITRLAVHPTAAEILEELDYVAQEILDGAAGKTA